MHAAMILCAGLGTRLRPLTEWRAKPMVPIGDRPAVDHITHHVRGARVKRIVVNVHHRPEDMRGWARHDHILMSEEADLLGTAGGIHRAGELLGTGDVLVWNGDILAQPNLDALFTAHAHAATLAVVPRARGEGNVGLDDDGRIVRLRKESFGAVGEETRGADFTGIHVVGARLRAALPTRGCIVGDVYIPALRHGERLDAHLLEGTFTDVGSLPQYVTANRAWLGARTSWHAADAQIHADIAGSIIGDGARIDADTTNCIVWPNAHVNTPTHDAVVTPHGNVPI